MIFKDTPFFMNLDLQPSLSLTNEPQIILANKNYSACRLGAPLLAEQGTLKASEQHTGKRLVGTFQGFSLKRAVTYERAARRCKSFPSV